MTGTTGLDDAHAAMTAETGGEASRLRFFERLADTGLFLLLAEEASGQSLSPEVFDLTDGRFVLCFDSEERLAQFAAGRAVPHAELSGRVLIGMLNGRGIGVALNPGVAPSEFLMPAGAVDWLHRMLGLAPDRVGTRVAGVVGPDALPAGLADALAAKLAPVAGLVPRAWLATVEYEGGKHGQLLGFAGVAPDAMDALAKAVAETLAFSGLEQGELDVGFLDPGDPLTGKLAAIGRELVLPSPPDPAPAPDPAAPGSDPDRPPILK